MLQFVRNINDLPYGKFKVLFECGHQVTFDSTRHRREGVKKHLLWSCPFCPMDFQVGDVFQLRLVYSEIPVVATFLGMSEGRFKFRFSQGEDSLLAREIVSYLKIN